MELSLVIVKGVLRIAAIVSLKPSNFDSFAVRACFSHPKVCAGILVAVSAITVGIVNNNKDFDDIRESRRVTQSSQQLKDLVDNTLSTSVWLILLSIIVLVWQGVYSILPLVSSHLSFLQRYSVVLAITVRFPVLPSLPLSHLHTHTHTANELLALHSNSASAIYDKCRMLCSVSQRWSVSWPL